MTTNLLISYPDIPFRAAITELITSATNHGFNNLTTGERGAHWKVDVATDYEAMAAFDLGATSDLDHIIVARADLLKALNCTYFQITSNSINNAGSAIARGGTDGDFQTRTFNGPDSEDLIFTSAYNSNWGTLPGTAHQYWWFYVGDFGGADKVWEFSKLYFGTFFDFGRDPIYPVGIQRIFTAKGERRPKYLVSLQWRGITNAKRQEFVENIVQYRDVNPIYLYDTNDLIFNGFKLLHAKISEVTITPTSANYNDIAMTLEELI